MPNNTLKNIQDIVSSIITTLEPAPSEPETTEEFYSVFFDKTENDNTKWKKLISENISTAKTFEIHCWAEETKEISLALKYGTKKETSWSYGTVIAGYVTDEFKNFILSLPKPADTDIYNKMTPFFSIFFDNGFSSSHYGTENFIPDKKV